MGSDVTAHWLQFWMFGPRPYDSLMRLFLLESDLESLRFALEDFSLAKKAATVSVQALDREDANDHVPSSEPTTAWSRMFHHAKTFVVSMRRFARLLEAIYDKRSEYPPPIAEAIDLAWRVGKDFYFDFKVARDA